MVCALGPEGDDELRLNALGPYLGHGEAGILAGVLHHHRLARGGHPAVEALAHVERRHRRREGGRHAAVSHQRQACTPFVLEEDEGDLDVHLAHHAVEHQVKGVRQAQTLGNDAADVVDRREAVFVLLNDVDLCGKLLPGSFQPP